MVFGNIFSFWQNKTRILSKISADRNGDSVLSATELSEYFGERYSEMVYLLRTYKSPAYYYDSQLDIFVMGDDWKGKFDFLSDLCEVVYLPRTPEISTTQIKEDLNNKV